MTSPAGQWDAGDEGTPDNQNAGMLQYVAFASLPTQTDHQGMVAIVTDGVAGNGGPPAVYVRADGTASWTLTGTLKGVAGCSLSDASSQSVSHGAGTAINFDTEDFDSDAFHDVSTNNNRITIPTGFGGKYLITASFNLATNSGGDWGKGRIDKNGGTTLAQQACGDDGSGLTVFIMGISVTCLVTLAAADYVQLLVDLDESAAAAVNVSNQTFAAFKLD